MSVAGRASFITRGTEPALDPDKQVQESIRFFFDTFRRTGSACAVVKAFRQQGAFVSTAAEEGAK